MASIFVVIGVALFDLLAFILAIVAEQRRSKATVEINQNNGDSYCFYSANVSTSYGIVALVFLLLSQAIIMVLSRCFCCGPPLPPGKNRTWSGICFIACWITFVIAEICLLAASLLPLFSSQPYYLSFIICSTQRPRTTLRALNDLPSA
ncbi:uncharacterized protein LOC144549014 isoform X2 [Carex rostrata]